MGKVSNKLPENSITTIIEDSNLKAKEKTIQIGKLILERKVSIDEIIQSAKSQKDSNKATLIEAMEYASKTKPESITSIGFEFAIQCLKERAPRVKWESARVIGNTAHLFPRSLKKAVPNLLDNTESDGTVVRWSAAYALSQIIQCKTSLNKELIPAVESILKREQDNAIKKKYQQSLKKVSP